MNQPRKVTQRLVAEDVRRVRRGLANVAEETDFDSSVRIVRTADGIARLGVAAAEQGALVVGADGLEVEVAAPLTVRDGRIQLDGELGDSLPKMPRTADQEYGAKVTSGTGPTDAAHDALVDKVNLILKHLRDTGRMVR